MQAYEQLMGALGREDEANDRMPVTLFEQRWVNIGAKKKTMILSTIIDASQMTRDSRSEIQSRPTRELSLKTPHIGAQIYSHDHMYATNYMCPLQMSTYVKCISKWQTHALIFKRSTSHHLSAAGLPVSRQ